MNKNLNIVSIKTRFQKGHKFLSGGEKGWFIKGQVPWNKDKKGLYSPSIEILKKQSIGLKKSYLNRISYWKGRMGENSAHWRGGGNKRWQQKVIQKRDNYTCVDCGLIDKNIMETDHDLPKSLFPLLKNDLNNLHARCPNCHKKKTIADREKWSYLIKLPEKQKEFWKLYHQIYKKLSIEMKIEQYV